MRWRFLDQVDRLDPWRSAAGRKLVSLEEYLLAEPLGREAALPETLVVECGVELLRWLVAKSSDFTQACVLESLADFRFFRAAGMGDVLAIQATVVSREADRLQAEVAVAVGGVTLASGVMGVSLAPLAASFDPAYRSEQWSEVHGQA